MPRKVKKQPLPVHAPQLGDLAPSIYMLDRFSASDLDVWKRRSHEFDEVHRELYHGLEPERQRRRDEILDALNSKPGAPVSFDGWVRMVQFRYANMPLSAAGSVRGVGGRFNIGSDCDDSGVAKVFPGLYIGDSHETAFRECYQIGSDELAATGLSAADLSLRTSDASVRLRGHVEKIFDLRDRSNLEPIAKILKKFKVTPQLERLAKNLKLGKADGLLIRTAARLQINMQEVNWRAWPQQFGLPAPSQRFGEFLRLAGYEGVIYRSTKLASGSCITIFPSNIDSDRTFVELQDPAHDGVKVTRLDIDSADGLCGWEHVRPHRRC
jgi:hypothetical protein